MSCFSASKSVFSLEIHDFFESQELGDLLLSPEARTHAEKRRHFCVHVCKRETGFSTGAKAPAFSVCGKRQTHGQVCATHTEGAGFSRV